MARVPFGHAARATRAVSSGMVPSSRGYMDMVLLLPHALFPDFFLALYHSSISGIRHNGPGALRRTTAHEIGLFDVFRVYQANFRGSTVALRAREEDENGRE